MKNLLFTLIFTFFLLIYYKPLLAQDEALKLVKSFLKDLDKQDFKSAYSKIAIAAWGDYKKFSSPNAFGNIEKVNIFDIKEENDIDSLTGIYVDAEYFDHVNGNARYKEKFYTRLVGNEMKIVKFKMIKKEKLPETVLHPSESDYRNFYAQVKSKLSLTDHKDIGDFEFINQKLVGKDRVDCLIMRRIESGCDMGPMIGFLCYRNSGGKWTLSQIADRFYDPHFFDFDKDSIMEIVEEIVYDCFGGDMNSYYVYSWKDNKNRVVFEYEEKIIPVFQFHGGEELDKDQLIADGTSFEVDDFNNDGKLELKEDINRTIVTKSCTYPESQDEKVLDKFFNDNTRDENRTVLYTLKNGKFIPK